MALVAVSHPQVAAADARSVRHAHGAPMPVWVKMIWTAFVVITVAMAIYIFVWIGALAGGCGNDMLASIPSPSGGRKLVIFQRACGATTGFSTQASLLPAHDRLRGSGNVFIADTDHGKAPSGPGGGPQLDARWTAEDTLELRYHPQARVFLADSAQPGVRIRFVKDSAL
jgi:hypothetical protein